MRMMFLNLCLIFSLNALAQIDISTEREIREREKAAKADDGIPDDFLKGTGIRLSPRYFKGEVLVYDCRDQHFVCTNMDSATDCREERDRYLAKDRFELPCVPIRRFKDHEECAEEQYKRVHSIPDKRWCYNEKKLRF